MRVQELLEAQAELVKLSHKVRHIYCHLFFAMRDKVLELLDFAFSAASEAFLLQTSPAA